MRSRLDRPGATAPAALVAALVLAAPAARAQSVYTWVGGDGVFWSSEDNWELDGMSVEDAPGCGPAIGAEVFFVADGEVIRVSCPTGANVRVGELTALSPLKLDAKLTLDGPSLLTDLRMDGAFPGLEVNADTQLVGRDIRWTRGAISGTATLRNAGTLIVPPSVNRGLSTRLENLDLFLHDGTTVLTSGGKGPVELLLNQGTIRGQGLIRQSTGQELFTNLGTILAEGGQLTVSAYLLQDAGSTLSAANGTELRIAYGTGVVGASTWAPAAGGTVRFQATPGADPYTIGDDVTVAGEGTVVIGADTTVQATGSLTADSEPTAETGLTLAAGTTLTLDGPLDVSGDMTLGGGLVVGPEAVSVTPGGRLSLLPSQERTFQNALLVLDGTVVQEGITRLHAPAEASLTGELEHRSGRLQGDGLLRIDGGSLRRPADSVVDVPRLQVPWELAAGALVVEAGTYRILDDGRLAGGTVRAETAGAVIDVGNVDLTVGPLEGGFGGGVPTLEGGGTIELGGTHLSVEAGAELVAQMAEPDGTLRIASSDVSGDGTLRNRGYLEWASGALSIGDTATLEPVGGLVNEAGGTFTTAPGPKTVSGALVNDGGEMYVLDPITLAATGRIVVRSGSLDLVAGNLVDLGDGDAAIDVLSGARLRKAAFEETGPSDVRTKVRLDGDASIVVEASTLELEDPLEVHGNASIVVRGGVLDLRGGGFGDVSNGDPMSRLTITDEPGPCRIRGGAWQTLDIDVRGLLETETATFGDDCKVRVFSGGEFRWSSGGFTASNTAVRLYPGGLVLLEGIGNRGLSGELDLFGGTVRHEGGELALGVLGEITVLDGSEYEIQGGASIGGASTIGIDSIGLLRKTQAGTATVAVPFDGGLSGTVQVDEGVLRLLGPIVQIEENGHLRFGTWRVLPGARLELSETIESVGPGVVVELGGPAADTMPAIVGLRTNEGTLGIPGGLDGPLDNRGTLDWSAGDLDVGGAVENDVDAPRSLIGDLTGVVELAFSGDGSMPRLLTPVVVNDGRILPGGRGTPGTVAITGDLEQGPQGIVEIDLLAGGLADVIDVDGAVVLDGRLHLRVADGADPTPGTQVTVLTATGAITGAFDEVVAPGGWSVSVDDGAVIATMTTAATCNADADDDGEVGLDELLGVLVGWGFCPSCAADLDGDDEVGLPDLLEVLAAWGPCG